ncbi:MAG TPA: cation diffusion facilitator family transporter [Kineosporiaceae bacterium]
MEHDRDEAPARDGGRRAGDTAAHRHTEAPGDTSARGRRQAGPHRHGHDHGRLPGGAVPGARAQLTAALAITLAVCAAQVTGAALSRSLALLADAGHLLTDVAGLALALLAAVLGERPPTLRRTWGYLRAEVLAAAAQAAVLLAVGGFVLVEGVRRLLEPPQVASSTMMWFGVVGLVGNAAGLALLARNRTTNLNLRAAFLEVANDALGALAVVMAAVAISITGWSRLDAVASLVIGVLIVPRTVRLLRESLTVLMESTPPGLDLEHVRRHVLEVEHVVGVHDLHASLVATGLPVLTAHVVVDDGCFLDGHVPQLLDALQRCLAGHFDVEHSTFQLEPTSHAAHEQAHHA